MDLIYFVAENWNLLLNIYLVGILVFIPVVAAISHIRSYHVDYPGVLLTAPIWPLSILLVLGEFVGAVIYKLKKYKS